MSYKKSLGQKVFNVFNILFLSLLGFVCIYPLLHITFASVSDPIRLSAHTGALLWPLGFTLKGYELVLKNPNILYGYMNTIFYVVAATSLNVLFTSMGAYVLSRKNLMFNKPIMMMITFTMYFGGGIIPFYIQMQNMHLIDTRWAMILPGMVGTWNLIVLRTSMMEIPVSLEEAARIDGANDFTILFRIILPLAKASIAVIALFYAVGHWNAWFNAMIFLRNRKLYPLQLILREILLSNNTGEMTSTQGTLGDDIYRSLVQYSTIMVATLPILCVYPFVQKYFVKGVMVGSIKG